MIRRFFQRDSLKAAFSKHFWGFLWRQRTALVLLGSSGRRPWPFVDGVWKRVGDDRLGAGGQLVGLIVRIDVECFVDAFGVWGVVGILSGGRDRRLAWPPVWSGSTLG